MAIHTDHLPSQGCGPLAAERTRLLSDLFHTLSQPLASLHCWLELAARYKSLPSGIRDELRQALGCVEQITWPVAAVRDLLDTTVDHELEKIRLQKEIDCLIEELRPVAQNRGVSLRFQPSSVGTVNFPKGRIHELLFRLFESSIAFARAGDILEVSLKSKDHRALIGIATSPKDAAKRRGPSRNGRNEKRSELSYRTAVCLVREVIEAIGGQVFIAQDGSSRTVSVVVPRPQKI